MGIRYFTEVNFRDDDSDVWDTLTRFLGLVESDTFAQAIVLHHFFELHPFVCGVETFVQSTDSAPYLLLTTYRERISQANVQRSRLQEAIAVLGANSSGLTEWLFMETTGDEH